MERKPSKHARSRSGALASFLRSTAASFSSTTTTFAARARGGKSSFNHRKAKKAAKASTCGMDGGACPLPPRPPVHPAASRPKAKTSLVKWMLFRRSRSRSSSSSNKPTCAAADAFRGRGSSVAAAPAAGLGHMKRFTSGRAAFQDFDWTADQAEPRGSDSDGYDSYEDDGFVAHSAPLVLGGGVVASEPRKEVNLWRRRPMSPPKPLQLP